MFRALIIDANGNGIGLHDYAEAPKSLPANEIACTDAQAADPSAWKDDGAGNLVAGPGPVPQKISFSQLVSALVIKTFITEAEGDAWLQGNAIPAAILGEISALPAAEQFPAKARLYRMSEVDRNNPLVALIAATQNLTSAQIDQFFQFADTL